MFCACAQASRVWIVHVPTTAAHHIARIVVYIYVHNLRDTSCLETHTCIWLLYHTSVTMGDMVGIALKVGLGNCCGVKRAVFAGSCSTTWTVNKANVNPIHIGLWDHPPLWEPAASQRGFWLLVAATGVVGVASCWTYWSPERKVRASHRKHSESNSHLELLWAHFWSGEIFLCQVYLPGIKKIECGGRIMQWSLFGHKSNNYLVLSSRSGWLWRCIALKLIGN